MDNQIQTLVEMGFSRDQAVDALKSSNNDLTKAIAYLFGEVDDTGAGTNASPYVVESAPIDSYDSVNVSNPQDLPEFLAQYASPEAMEAPALPGRYNEGYYTNEVSRGGNSIDNATSNAVHGDNNAVHVDHDDMDDVGDIDDEDMDVVIEIDENYDHGPNVKTEGHLFPVVLCGSTKYRYWASMVAILAQFSPFAEPLLSSDATTDFVSELQRIVYFLRNFRKSNRWYISADPLVAQLVDTSDSDVAAAYTDEEAVLNAYEFMMQQHQQLRTVLESLVESVEENISKELTVLEIDSDTRRNNLYNTLNELFWQRGFVKLGQIKYKQVAPVVTYQLIGESTNYSVPFELQETVYPEIYSDIAEKAVEREVKQMREAEVSLQAVTRKLMELNFFEGKKILSLLRQAVGALGGVNGHNNKALGDESLKGKCNGNVQGNEMVGNEGLENDVNDNMVSRAKEVSESAVNGCEKGARELSALGHQIEGARLAQIGKQNALRKQALGEQLGQYDEIPAECNLKPYDLLGVICGDDHYYVRQDLDTYLRMDERTLVDFEDVEVDVAHLTRRGSHLITLVYGQREGCATLDDDESEEESKNSKNEDDQEYGKEENKEEDMNNDSKLEASKNLKETQDSQGNRESIISSTSENSLPNQTPIESNYESSGSHTDGHERIPHLGTSQSQGHCEVESASLAAVSTPSTDSTTFKNASTNSGTNSNLTSRPSSITIPNASSNTPSNPNSPYTSEESDVSKNLPVSSSKVHSGSPGADPLAATIKPVVAQLIVDQFRADEDSAPIRLD